MTKSGPNEAEGRGPTPPPLPLREAAIEACARVGEPLSPLLLYEVLDRSVDPGTLAYHLCRLAEEGTLAGCRGLAPGGAVEQLYLLAT
jgi:hypothetical protein